MRWSRIAGSLGRAVVLTPLQYVLGAEAGALTGFSLGLVGGGGSILAVPLTVYLVGVADVHVAVGTSALAVATNASTSLIHHTRRGHVNWPAAGIFAAAGVVSAYMGSVAGKALDASRLLQLFALFMIAVALLMLRLPLAGESARRGLARHNRPKLLLFGGAAGGLAGFFGIGGGFLIVPGLIASTQMPLLVAIGSSLVAVTAFGFTTALSYASSGWIDWSLAMALAVGGLGGGRVGVWLAARLSTRGRALNHVLAAVLVGVAGYVLYRSTVAGGVTHGNNP